MKNNKIDSKLNLNKQQFIASSSKVQNQDKPRIRQIWSLPLSDDKNNKA